MYLPRHFKSPSPEATLGVVRNNAFGLLVSTGSHASPSITHVPMLTETDGDHITALIGHLAKANNHVEELTNGQRVTAVFSGPHAYVSPRWYESTNSVATWNYVSVHVHGRITLTDATSTNADVVSALSSEFEPEAPNGWAPDFDNETVRRMLDFIVSFRVEVDDVQAKFKLNQNRPVADRRGVVNALEQGSSDDRAIAELMKGFDR